MISNCIAVVVVLAGVLLSSPEVRGLHIVRVDVPGAVGAGTNNLLQCDYDLNGTSLYVLRWYKDDQEFFRFMPKESPAKRNFHVEGVHVNMSQSTSKRLWLSKVTKSTGGLFRCEVSGEGPAFDTDAKDAHFVVVDPPKGKPFITSSFITPNGNVIGPNESLTANCSGPSGRPPPTLTWTLAGIQIEEKYTTHRLYVVDDQNESFKSMLELPMSWLNQHGHYGETVQLRCVSRLRGLFEDTDTVELRWRRDAQEPASADAAPSSITERRPSLHGALTNEASVSSSTTSPSLFVIAVLSGWLLVTPTTPTWYSISSSKGRH